MAKGIAMTFSLWRNDEHLGDIVLPLPTTGRHADIAGVFTPMPAFHDLAPIMQVRLPLPPVHPVLQTPIAHTRSAGPGPFEPLVDDQARAAPDEQQFVLRDSDGNRLPTHMIALDRLPLPPTGHPDLVAEACAAANVPYSGWYLHAALDEGTGGREV